MLSEATRKGCKLVLGDAGIALSAYRRFAFSLVFAVLLVGQHAVAREALDRSVDAYIRSEMTKRRIPGLALAVIQHGRIEKTSSYGLADSRQSRAQVAPIGISRADEISGYEPAVCRRRLGTPRHI